jgi:transposase InsO family protein
MPWKELTKMNERVRFIGRLLDGEKMSDLCREFGISRVTGHKFWKRYQQQGMDALSDRSRRPHFLARSTSPEIVRLITDLKRERPTWGAPKIWSYLSKRNKTLKLPAASTVHAILDREGLVKKRGSKRQIYEATGTDLIASTKPNDVWCADFKGQFKMGNRQYCYPLTVSDHFSRYLLSCEALESTKSVGAVTVFKEIFREHGLPASILSDNGTPFGSVSLFGLSKLSVWWLRLGIMLQRIEPGHPEQNGRHERMHRTLKQAATKPPGQHILNQQELFDGFKEMYNQERPHEAIAMRTPSEIYNKSTRQYPEQLPDMEYPECAKSVRVAEVGTITIKQKRVFISEVFAGEVLGLAAVDEGIYEVNFMQHEIGYFDSQSMKFAPAENPFLKPKKPVLTMSQV